MRLPLLQEDSIVRDGDYLWEASAEMKAEANITKFMQWLATHKDKHFTNYEAVWQWSVTATADFWEAIWQYFEVSSSTPYTTVVEGQAMPHIRWFTGAKVNYAAHVLRNYDDNAVAIHSYSETRATKRITWGQLAQDVMKLATYLRKLGVKKGDTVGAYMPNIYETVVALLATTSIGAVWSSCSPDFGTKSVLERFSQIEPTILIAIDGYTHNGKRYDRRTEITALEAALPSVKNVIYVAYAFETPQQEHIFADILQQPAIAREDFIFEEVDFSHPLWVLYSSGTTGIPKAIVHGHGGVLLEMYKVNTFHLNLKPTSTMFFYTTTGWMMFNLLISGLLTKGRVVLYDGSPSYPSPKVLWQIAAETKTTMFGSSPAFVQIMKKLGLSPKREFNLEALESIILSGSPANADVFKWMYLHVKRDLWLTSQSGGTDVCSGFVGATPINSVHASEIQVRMLGVAAYAFDEEGNALTNTMGELVITKPMPSMPLYFWQDTAMTRYKDSYFKVYPNIWRHGDYMTVTERGTCLIHGRSDATLNRAGVRIGTSEIYRIVETLPEVQDSLIVHLENKQGEFFMPLFIKLQEGAVLNENLRQQINKALRQHGSPRHVPDAIYAVRSIPYTLTMKKMEVPVRQILLGVAPEKAAQRDAMTDRDALTDFIALRDKLIQLQ